MNNTSKRQNKSNWKKRKNNSKHHKPNTTNRKSQTTTNKSKRPAKQKQGPSKLDPALLVKKAVEIEVKDFRSDRLFDSMPLSNRLKQVIKRKGFERPSEIQDKTLETLLEGKDLLGIAQTGTGKTGAFLIPIIEQLLQDRKHSYALIVVPTRELATQVDEEFKSLTKGLGLFSACFIGGTNIRKDIQTLRRPNHVVIGTPGRLLDLDDRKALKMRHFNTLVLDEFDRMLDMGFIHDVKRMVNTMHNRKHTMLFSATLDKKQQSLIDTILSDPITVKVSSGEASSDHINQDVIFVNKGDDKFKMLVDMLRKEEFKKVILFDEAKYKVSKLSDRLKKAGIKSDAIHGNKSQNARQKALDAFKENKIKVLAATDVAARGIDVSDVTHVINFQLPMTFDSYIHRIGRTGRAGKIGQAYTFVDVLE